ncbi:S-adenosyl-L-methionine-dependent methyltransferase [Cercophora newfieldiana]|uniref:S-adenosyl-L-methionine-dependent methyltransferase n=1 Tax=Cercophora newfieldiana TaxID=92897 RepID=A0AA40CWV0_9PEZI|nr:S-adenosyl-L-methionine-dependent methyltransferase [Cercophora newfieldiana]
MATQTQDVANQLEMLGSRLMLLSHRLRNGASLESQRNEILEATAQVNSSLATDDDDVHEMLNTFAKAVSIRLFIKWGAFKALPPIGQDISISDLAKTVGAEPGLLIRYAYVLSAAKIIRRTGDRVSHTRRSLQYPTTPRMAQFVFDEMLPPILASPAYFAKYGLREPTCRKNSLFSFGHGKPGVSVWEVINSSPERTANCIEAMKMMDLTYPFLAPYDLTWAVETAKLSDRPVVVDVGGGSGHALKEIVKVTPGLTMERCVLQDLPKIVDAAKAAADPELKGVKFAGMDFHAEQPVKEALVYYVRRVLHDYSDETCVKILKNIRDAMAADSRLLVVEQVMGEPPSLFATASNIFMTSLSGKERTLEDIRELATRAGLGVVKAHWGPNGEAAVIECAKAM